MQSPSLAATAPVRSQSLNDSMNVVVQELQVEVKNLKTTVKGLHARLQRLTWIEERLADIESNQESAHPSTRCDDWDNDMFDVNPDLPTSQPSLNALELETHGISPFTSGQNSVAFTSNPFVIAHHTTPPATVRSFSNPSASSTPNSCSLLTYKTDNVLLSDEIDRSSLDDADVVMRRYVGLKGEAKAGELTTKLARETFFGSAIMARCTVGGASNLPAFPAREMNALKQKVFSRFPSYWQNPANFEGLWLKCTRALNAACRALRRAQLRGITMPPPES